MDNLLKTNPECRATVKAKMNRLRLDIHRVHYFGKQQDPKQAYVIWGDVKVDEEGLRMQNIINAILSKFIEFGVVQENKMEHARFDLSEMKYKLEQPHVTLMKKRGGVFNAVPILKHFHSYSFGYCDINTIMLSKMDKGYTCVHSARLS